MEYQVYPHGSPVSTYEFHKDRKAGHHSEEPHHKDRMKLAADLVLSTYPETVMDLGAGDGGMLRIIDKFLPKSNKWGYDFTPDCVASAQKHNTRVFPLNFIQEPQWIKWAECTIITEVLEHLEDPHGWVQHMSQNTTWVVASSPATETAQSHDECHAWVWDMDGYRALFENNGFDVEVHEQVGMFQVLRARSTTDDDLLLAVAEARAEIAAGQPVHKLEDILSELDID